MAKPYQCAKCSEPHSNPGECPKCGPGRQYELCPDHMTGYSPHCRRCRRLAKQ